MKVILFAVFAKFKNTRCICDLKIEKSSWKLLIFGVYAKEAQKKTRTALIYIFAFLQTGNLQFPDESLQCQCSVPNAG